ASGLGIDASSTALAVAQANAHRLGMANRAMFERGNWATGLAETFDLILCNPPYVEAQAVLARDVVEWEPHEALFAGRDGLDAYRMLAPQLTRLIAPGGVACLEIGGNQEASAGALFAAKGLGVALRLDLASR